MQLAWLKNLVMKVKNDTTRRSMFKRLRDIMHNHKNVESSLEEANRFLNEFKEENSFVEYFRARWLDIIGLGSYYNIQRFLFNEQPMDNLQLLCNIFYSFIFHILLDFKFHVFTINSNFPSYFFHSYPMCLAYQHVLYLLAYVL